MESLDWPCGDAVCLCAGGGCPVSTRLFSLAALHLRRRYLAYSMLGYITTREEATNASVDVGFHDTSRQGGRVKAMMDYYGFTLGALGDQVCSGTCYVY